MSNITLSTPFNATVSEMEKDNDYINYVIDREGIPLSTIREYLFTNYKIYLPSTKEEVKSLYPGAKGHTSVTIALDNLANSTGSSTYLGIRMVRVYLKDLGPIYLKSAGRDTSSDHDDFNAQNPFYAVLTSDPDQAPTPHLYSIEYTEKNYKLQDKDIVAIIDTSSIYNNEPNYQRSFPLFKDADVNGGSTRFWLSDTVDRVRKSEDEAKVEHWRMTIFTHHEVEKVEIIPGTATYPSITGDITIKYDNESVLSSNWNMSGDISDKDNVAEEGVNKFTFTVESNSI